MDGHFESKAEHLYCNLSNENSIESAEQLRHLQSSGGGGSDSEGHPLVHANADIALVQSSSLLSAYNNETVNNNNNNNNSSSPTRPPPPLPPPPLAHLLTKSDLYSNAADLYQHSQQSSYFHHHHHHHVHQKPPSYLLSGQTLDQQYPAHPPSYPAPTNTGEDSIARDSSAQPLYAHRIPCISGSSTIDPPPIIPPLPGSSTSVYPSYRSSFNTMESNISTNVQHPSRTKSGPLQTLQTLLPPLDLLASSVSGGGNASSSNAMRAPNVQRSADQQVSRRGWLHRLEGGPLKQWRRRWFVLGEYCLFYYKDAQEEKLIGSVLLPSYSVCACDPTVDGIQRKHSFKLTHQNMKSHFLAAETSDSAAQWMHLLHLAANLQLNYANSEQLPPALSVIQNSSVSAALAAVAIARSRPDTQHMMDVLIGRHQQQQQQQQTAHQQSGLPEFLPEQPPSYSTSLQSSNHHAQYDANNIRHLQREHQSQMAAYGMSMGPSRSSPGPSIDPYGMNSIGLPPVAVSHHYPADFTVYPSQPRNSAELSAGNLIAKRPHYVNAPPKPRRHQQYGEQPYGETAAGVAPDLLPQSNGLPQSPDYELIQQQSLVAGHRSQSAEMLDYSGNEPDSFMHGNELHRSRPNVYESYVSDRPARPKSSIERFDMANDQHAVQQHMQQHSNQRFVVARGQQSSGNIHPAGVVPSSPPPPVSTVATSAPTHRPWSEFLQQSTSRDSNCVRSQSTNEAQPINGPVQQKSTVPAREESVHRLMEWKQRMSQSPSNRRSNHGNESQQQDRLPNRPPLPNEYNEQNAEETRQHSPPSAVRERSQSFATVPQQQTLPNGIDYSSDDEGKFFFNSFNFHLYSIYTFLSFLWLSVCSFL